MPAFTCPGCIEKGSRCDGCVKLRDAARGADGMDVESTDDAKRNSRIVVCVNHLHQTTVGSWSLGALLATGVQRLVVVVVRISFSYSIFVAVFPFANAERHASSLREVQECIGKR